MQTLRHTAEEKALQALLKARSAGRHKSCLQEGVLLSAAPRRCCCDSGHHSPGWRRLHQAHPGRCCAACAPAAPLPAAHRASSSHSHEPRLLPPRALCQSPHLDCVIVAPPTAARGPPWAAAAHDQAALPRCSLHAPPRLQTRKHPLHASMFQHNNCPCHSPQLTACRFPGLLDMSIKPLYGDQIYMLAVKGEL